MRFPGFRKGLCGPVKCTVAFLGFFTVLLLLVTSSTRHESSFRNKGDWLLGVIPQKILGEEFSNTLLELENAIGIDDEWDLSPLDAAQMSRILKDANDGSESRIYVFADSAYFSFVQNYLCIANRLEFQRLGWSVHVAATDATLAHRLSQWPEDIRFTVINLAPEKERGISSGSNALTSGTKTYAHLISKKVPFILSLLESGVNNFLFTDADITFRDARILKMMQGSPWCDLTFMVDQRDLLSIQQLKGIKTPSTAAKFESMKPRRPPRTNQWCFHSYLGFHPGFETWTFRDTVNSECLKQYRKARLNINNSTGAISRPSWKDYPSHWSKEKVKEHDLKHRDDIPAERAQYIHRDGQQFVYTNMGFVHIRNNQRTRSFYQQLLARMTTAVNQGTFIEEQHILRELLKSENAPDHRFLHVLDSETAESLPDDTLKICLLPPELAPNGFLLFRLPWNLDYYYAFSDSDDEIEDIEIGCPCTQHGFAKMTFGHFGNNASVVHYNGLIPKQKFAAVDGQKLWYLQVQDSTTASSLLDTTCSASPVAPSGIKTLPV